MDINNKTMEQITIKELAPYLPYGLKCQYLHKTSDVFKIDNNVFTMDVLDCDSTYKVWTYDKDFCKQLVWDSKGFRLRDFKPLLKPLSDYKDINGEAMRKDVINAVDFLPVYELANGMRKLETMPYGTIQLMAQNHIDFQDLISRGLAINLNELKQ